MTTEDVTIINLPDVSDAQEPTAVPAGEYKVRIATANVGMVGEGKKNAGKPYLKVMFEVMGEEGASAALVSDILMFPHSDMDAKGLNNAKLRIKRFYDAFGIVAGEADTANLRDKEGWVMLDVRHDEQYGEQNRVKRYIAGR